MRFQLHVWVKAGNEQMANISLEYTEFAVSTRMSLRNLVRIRQMLSALKLLENRNE